MKRLKYCLAILYGMIIQTSFGQFEQKMTINVSVGSLVPSGVKEYIHHDIYTNENGGMYDDAYKYPYLFANFKPGITITGGLQFNLNRYFALGAGIGFEKSGKWKYTKKTSWNGVESEFEFLEWQITDQYGNVLEDGQNALSFYNMSIGVFPRVNYFLYGKRINPYIYTEITFNYTDINYDNSFKAACIKWDAVYPENSKISYGKTPQNSFGLGLYPGVGFDININSNLGVFIQGGYAFIKINKDDMEEAKMEPENFKAVKFEFGVKVSFLRSKDI